MHLSGAYGVEGHAHQWSMGEGACTSVERLGGEHGHQCVAVAACSSHMAVMCDLRGGGGDPIRHCHEWGGNEL